MFSALSFLLLDEPVQNVLELVGVVGAVDDVALVLEVELRLGAQLAAEILGGVYKIEPRVVKF